MINREPRAQARRAGATLAAVALAACGLAACSSSGAPAAGGTQGRPGALQEILTAPKGLRAATEPQPNGTLWALAGSSASQALFEFNLSSSQRPVGVRPVSATAQSVAESLSGVIGLALGTGRSGALELLDGTTGTPSSVIPIGAPARQVVVGSDGSTFYVLDGTATSSSVTIIDSQDGRILGTVPVPLDTTSVVPDVQETTIYALQPNGVVSQIALADGQVETSFQTGGEAKSIALSPDGGTLYVLKGPMTEPNVAVVDVATQSVSKVLPAPANCLQILVSANGDQLYQMVGTAGYGNIQVFAS
ncbi:MAG TPA: hypothetical protein VG142_19470 [Trebonia sp.]|jgi:hypothetical protein|nr:hypothetical protein [Trebonia sp.]